MFNRNDQKLEDNPAQKSAQITTFSSQSSNSSSDYKTFQFFFPSITFPIKKRGKKRTESIPTEARLEASVKLHFKVAQFLLRWC